MLKYDYYYCYYYNFRKRQSIRIKYANAIIRYSAVYIIHIKTLKFNFQVCILVIKTSLMSDDDKSEP